MKIYETRKKVTIIELLKQQAEKLLEMAMMQRKTETLSAELESMKDGYHNKLIETVNMYKYELFFYETMEEIQYVINDIVAMDSSDNSSNLTAEKAIYAMLVNYYDFLSETKFLTENLDFVIFQENYNSMKIYEEVKTVVIIELSKEQAEKLLWMVMMARNSESRMDEFMAIQEGFVDHLIETVNKYKYELLFNSTMENIQEVINDVVSSDSSDPRWDMFSKNNAYEMYQNYYNLLKVINDVTISPDFIIFQLE